MSAAGWGTGRLVLSAVLRPEDWQHASRRDEHGAPCPAGYVWLRYILEDVTP